MASKRRNMFQKNKTQETTENGIPEYPITPAFVEIEFVLCSQDRSAFVNPDTDIRSGLQMSKNIEAAITPLAGLPRTSRGRIKLDGGKIPKDEQQRMASISFRHSMGLRTRFELRPAASQRLTHPHPIP
ncbi:hypothetical protein AAG570_000073 [Ranatra chinensis]|uniref:Uncharacterized protein n=1 Tax=Ranatra chinensis TaxID=642074 RepID=A0ABD0YW13_9HEMI